MYLFGINGLIVTLMQHVWMNLKRRGVEAGKLRPGEVEICLGKLWARVARFGLFVAKKTNLAFFKSWLASKFFIIYVLVGLILSLKKLL